MVEGPLSLVILPTKEVKSFSAIMFSASSTSVSWFLLSALVLLAPLLPSPLVLPSLITFDETGWLILFDKDLYIFVE